VSIEDSFGKLNNLDPDNIGSWPILLRAILWIVTAVVAGFVVYQLMLSKSIIELQQLERKESELIETFEERAYKAANLGLLRKQMEEMKETFTSLARQLPNSSEVPGLLEELSVLGVDSGLALDDLSLGKEKESEFYYEQPIQMSVRGTYHGMGAFVSGIAALPRIVTLHDFTITPQGDEDGGGLLIMTVLAKTYRYNEEEA